MSTASITPVKMRRHDDDLLTDVLRVVGYRAACPCGWLGKVRRSVMEARTDAAEHACDTAA